MAERLSYEVIKRLHEEKLKEYMPADNAVICRYMEFPKFMSLVHSKSLFFTRADKFEDPLEGEVPEHYIEKISIFLNSSPFKLFSDTDTKVSREEILHKFYQYRKMTFISCWNEFNSESYALWKIYANKYGVAIQTTVKKLKELTKPEGAMIYKVKYINENTKDFVVPSIPNMSELNSQNFFVCKRNQYSYENEIRAILTGRNGEFQEIQINKLSSFIDRIYVSPFAEEWFLKLVRDVTINYGLEKVKILNSNVII